MLNGNLKLLHAPPNNSLMSAVKLFTAPSAAFLFVKASVIWGECLNYRGEREWGLVDTFPRLRSLLQTKMGVAPSKRTSLDNPTEK